MLAVKLAVVMCFALAACPPPPDDAVPAAPCFVYEGEEAATITCDNGVRAIVFKRPDGEWTAGGCFWNESIAP